MGKGTRQSELRELLDEVYFYALEPTNEFMEDSGLTIELAQSLATHLTSVGEPAGCGWCVGVWEEAEQVVAGQSACLERKLTSALLPPLIAEAR